jgi:hypothetical protein
MLKYFPNIFIVAVSLLFFTDCKKEFTSQKESGFLFFDEPGSFRLHTLQELSDGNLLVAGTSDYRQAGISFSLDSASIYIVNPDDFTYKNLSSIFEDFYTNFGAIEAENQSLIVWALERNRQTVLRKYDKNFKILKQKTIKSITPDRGSYNITVFTLGAINSIVKLKDGNYLLVGRAGLKAQLVKFDTDLNIIWQQESNKVLRDFVEAENGSILFGGYNPNTNKAVLSKYKPDGTLMWEKEMNLPKNASFYNLLYKNSEYWGTGYFSWSPDFQGKTEGFILKFNQNGDSLACKTFSSELDDEGQKLLPTADGGMIFLMHIDFQASRKSKLIKLDANLNVVWEKPFGRNGDFVSLVSAITLKNGNIVIGGFGDHIVKDLNSKDGFILVLDKNGNPI